MKSVCTLAIAVLIVAYPGRLQAEDFEVTVVTILASDRHKNIEPKLKAVAEEIQKKDHSLTGWRIERTTRETMPLNHKHTFKLVDDVAAEITLLAKEEKEKDKDKRVRVNVKVPHAGEITYSTVPDKYFPVLTRYQTNKDKERLVYAIMVKFLPPK